MKKFTSKQNEVLTEIYRRLNYFHGGNLNTNLLYLGLPSSAKLLPDLLTPSSKEVPRALNWYKLTEKGQRFFKNYVTKRRISDKMNSRLFRGEIVKKFNPALLEES